MRKLIGFLVGFLGAVLVVSIAFRHPEYSWRAMMLIACIAVIAVLVLLGMIDHYSPQRRYQRRRRAELERDYGYLDERDRLARFHRELDARPTRHFYSRFNSRS